MKAWTAALAVLLAAPSAGLGNVAQDTPTKVKLWKLDCGALDENKARPFAWEKAATPTPCFLIAHGDRYLLWDSGISARAIGTNHPVAKLDRSIVDQLKQLRIGPEKIEFVGISHYHGDHTGQASHFPNATLLIGARDFQAYGSKPAPGGAAADHLKPWLSGEGKAELLIEDKDVFGDGSVKILMTPGHTPGHSSLLVNLASGPVILTGDLWFSHADALRSAMPDFNTSRAETFASRERIARLAEKLDAAIIIQHEPADLAKLPAFPTALE